MLPIWIDFTIVIIQHIDVGFMSDVSILCLISRVDLQFPLSHILCELQWALTCLAYGGTFHHLLIFRLLVCQLSLLIQEPTNQPTDSRWYEHFYITCFYMLFFFFLHWNQDITKHNASCTNNVPNFCGYKLVSPDV